MDLCTLLFVVIASAFPPSTQDDDMRLRIEKLILARGGVILDGNVGVAVHRPSLQSKRELSELLEIRIAELKRICGFDQAQEKKLHLMAKKLVDQHMAKYLRLQRLQEQGPWNKDAGEPPLQGPEPPGMDPFKLEIVTQLIEEIEKPSVEVIRTSEVWQAALLKVLTREQQKTLEESNDQRRRYRIRACVDHALYQLDVVFRFSEQQRHELSRYFVSLNALEIGDLESKELISIIHGSIGQTQAHELPQILDDVQQPLWDKKTNRLIAELRRN